MSITSTFIPGLCCSPYFYPLPTTSDTTTLRESELGIRCWFTFQYMEVFRFNETANDWIHIETTDTIMVYLNGKLIYQKMGFDFVSVVSCSVGVKESRTVWINELLQSQSVDYYTLRVYGASRSCSISPSLRSSLVWQTSAQKAVDFETVLNHDVEVTSQTAATNDQVLWESESVARLQYSGFVSLSLDSLDFYRIAFNIQSSSSARSDTFPFFCVLVKGVAGMSSIPLRAGMVMNNAWTNNVCSIEEGRIGFVVLANCCFM